jgi:hypothetical protein
MIDTRTKSIAIIQRCPVMYRTPQSQKKQRHGEIYLVNPTYKKLVNTYRIVRGTQDHLNVYCTGKKRDALVKRSIEDFMSGNWDRR